jgi:hypothetical protein
LWLPLSQTSKNVFSLLSILLKIQRTGEGNWSCQVQRGLVLVGGGGGEESWEEGWIWCKYCVHMHVNAKMKPVDTIPAMDGEGHNEE